MVDGSWNSPEWQFASFPFALLSQWSRKVIYSTMTLVQSAAIQPCWFIWAIHWEVLPCSGSAGACEFHVDFYCCLWVVKGFSYYNQIFLLLCSLGDAELSCPQRMHGWKWIRLEVTAIWEWGSCKDFKSCSIVFTFLQCLCCCCHMITINRCEETTSNIFSTQSITWHTQMPCTLWIIITGPQL